MTIKDGIIKEAWRKYFGDSVDIDTCLKYNSLETREQLSLMSNTYDETIEKIKELIKSCNPHCELLIDILSDKKKELKE